MLNAKNMIDNTMPTNANVVTVKNAYLETEAILSLKTRFAMGTTLFSHLIVMQFWQLKSSLTVSG